MRCNSVLGILFSISTALVIFALASWLWLKDNTRPAEALVAERTFTRLHDETCMSDLPGNIDIQEDFMYFNCEQAAGHNNFVSIRFFENASAARDAFEQRREDHPVTDFHGYPSSYYENQGYLVPGGLQKVFIWQARHMLIKITSFDDTHFRIARDPNSIAENLYAIATEEGLIPTSP